ncbi:TPA: hypothetical protein QEF70_000579 [Stenotrophomonas maltophilia]|nr:hypothetical protein [Stenotrophomonas maltophilia]
MLLPTLASGNAHDAFAHIAASVLELPRASANKQFAYSNLMKTIIPSVNLSTTRKGCGRGTTGHFSSSANVTYYLIF